MLLKTTTLEVKKAGHTDRNKPYTTFSTMVPSETAARALFQNITPISDSKIMIKWKIEGIAISRWFDDDAARANPIYIHPVLWYGTFYSCGDPGPEEPFLYVWAGFHSVEAKFHKKTNLLSLKVQTSVAGTGDPDGSDQPPHLKRT